MSKAISSIDIALARWSRRSIRIHGTAERKLREYYGLIMSGNNLILRNESFTLKGYNLDGQLV